MAELRHDCNDDECRQNSRKEMPPEHWGRRFSTDPEVWKREVLGEFPQEAIEIDPSYPFLEAQIEVRKPPDGSLYNRRVFGSWEFAGLDELCEVGFEGLG